MPKTSRNRAASSPNASVSSSSPATRSSCARPSGWGRSTSLEVAAYCATSRSEEDRYWLTSLAPDTQKLLEPSRGHWGIENQCHWVMDVTYGEYGSRIRSDHAARNASLLRHLAHNLFKHDQTVKDYIAGQRKRACLSIATLERFLKLSISK